MKVPDALAGVLDVWPHRAPGLPPGQGLARVFRRWGTHLTSPPPAVPDDPVIAIEGAGAAPIELTTADLRDLPRRTLVADFHCVAGWSVRALHWEGVAFRTLWDELIAPNAESPDAFTHLTFAGLDGYRSVLTVEDALGDDVLIADRLGGEPLADEHGAPARLVSPAQYGYMSTKHLCRIELHTGAPGPARHRSALRASLLWFVAPHPRARIAHQERHRDLPAWSIGFVYRRVALPLLATRMGPAARRDADRSPRRPR
jgi:DMSO/TMAO reductase YedYZ molybdopterin-dependent catalytic subunit